MSAAYVGTRAGSGGPATSVEEMVGAVWPLVRWRRWLTWVLAAIWLLDAHLQFQPFMFTAGKDGFPQTVIAPTGVGSPGWVSGPVRWATRLMDSNIGFWNFWFAAAQVAIGLALIWRTTVRVALAASIVWAASLWWIGEGLGGILAGPVSPLMGLPGAAVLYVLISVLVWPHSRREGDSVATTGVVPAWVTRGAWALLWLLFAWEALRPADRSARALHDTVAGMAGGEPGWMHSIDSWGASVLGSRGLAFSISIAVICLSAAAAPFLPPPFLHVTRAALGAVIVLSSLIWVFGENLGRIATGEATDPNTGPLLVLLALAFWPIKTSRSTTRPAAPAAGTTH